MTEIRNRICLWYDGDAEEAFTFYAATFSDTKVESVEYAPSDYPDGKKGDALVVTATIVGIPTIGLNGGNQFPQSEAFSFQVITEDQEETDRLWNAVVGNGGQESQCGWCKDKWGLNWQITPRVLLEAQQGDPAKAKRVFEAMMSMKKIDVAAIEAAARG
jgi:predicted 3-demethylubiquinone-9 3-methyltransferase (glyoxalase superfamily)